MKEATMVLPLLGYVALCLFCFDCGVAVAYYKCRHDRKR